MSFVSEFREFAIKGNVMDMAVGIIIGGAFGKIVTSAVNDVLMPLIGQLAGGMSFVDNFYAFDGGNYPTLEAAKKAGTAVIAYGSFLQAVFDFVMVALCIFLMIKWMNKLKQEEPETEAPPEPGEDVVLLREIRDALSHDAAR